MKFIRIFLFVLIIIGLGLLFTQKKWVPNFVDYLISRETKVIPYEEGYKWSGSISGIRQDCADDGVCSITVSGREIIVESGFRVYNPNEKVGTLFGFDSVSEAKNHIGERVEVYVAKLENGKFTLYGKSEYYIKLLK